MNRLFSFILITALVFSLNFNVVKAGGVAEAVGDAIGAVVDVVEAVVDVVVGAVNTAVNTVINIVEYTSANILDIVGAEELANTLRKDALCRFTDITGDIDISACSEEIPLTSLPVAPPPGTSIGEIETWSIGGATQPLCNSVTLSGINAQGHNYAIVRNGQIVAQLLASETSYTDTGLVPHTNYEYKIRIPYPPEIVTGAPGGGSTPPKGEAGTGVGTSQPKLQTTDSAPIKAYTKCFPQCGFGVKEKSVAKFGNVTFVWNCNYNDPSVDKGSCRIEDAATGKKHGISATSGILEIPVTVDSTFVLSCTNVDGTISVPQSIKVFEPGIKEVKP